MPSIGPIAGLAWRPRVDDLAGIVLLFALNRIVLIMTGSFAWNHQLPEAHWRGIDRAGIRYALIAGQPLLDMWTRWDSWEYEEIARRGYWYDYRHKPSPYGTVACFPLYPLAIRAVGMVLGGRYVIAGLLVSNASALLGFILLFQWAAWWRDRASAWVAVSAAISFPSGLFWSALYPQSLFFALSIATLLLMLDGRPALSGLFGAAATATRLEGIAILPALLAIQLRRGRGRVGREVLWLLLVPTGLIGYMAFLYWRWGDPFLFLKVHALFGRGLTNPLWTLVEPWERLRGRFEPDLIITYIIVVLLLIGHASRLSWPVLLYGWLLFLIPLCTGVYISIYRVHLVNFPIYLSLGLAFRGRWRPVAWGLILVFLVLQVATMVKWVAGYFIP
jgi:hypothetical protein